MSDFEWKYKLNKEGNIIRYRYVYDDSGEHLLETIEEIEPIAYTYTNDFNNNEKKISIDKMLEIIDKQISLNKESKPVIIMNPIIEKQISEHLKMDDIGAIHNIPVVVKDKMPVDKIYIMGVDELPSLFRTGYVQFTETDPEGSISTTIKRRWLNEILSGEKKIEYKEATTHWITRLDKYRGKHRYGDLYINFLCGRISHKFVVREVRRNIGSMNIDGKDVSEYYEIHLGTEIK